MNKELPLNGFLFVPYGVDFHDDNTIFNGYTICSGCLPELILSTCQVTWGRLKTNKYLPLIDI